LSDWDKAIRNWNGLPRPKIRFSPGVFNGII
jgi:hypothetical protein